MKKITEKVVISRTPGDVRLYPRKLPAHERDALCRVVLRGVAEAFKNPQFAADYETWLAAKRAKEATT